MNANYDKNIFLSNIRDLAKQKKVSLKEIEKLGGVSEGAIKRMLESENSRPSINLLIAASKKLGVSADFLLNGSYSGLDEKQKLLLPFVEKLAISTKAGKSEWMLNTDFLHNEPDWYDSRFFILDPYNEICYVSDFYQGKHVEPIKAYCYLTPDDKAMYYLIEVAVSDTYGAPGKIELEFYYTNRDERIPLCCSHFEDKEDLYNRPLANLAKALKIGEKDEIFTKGIDAEIERLMKEL